jgi:hypothetical protein
MSFPQNRWPTRHTKSTESTGASSKCRVTRESSARSARPSNCHTLDLPPVRTVEGIDQNKLGVFSSPPSPFARRMMTSL